MTTYAYTALEADGRRTTGYVEAESKDTAIASLSGAGRFVVEIKERAQRESVVPNAGGRISRGDIALFTRRLADLSAAGLPLDRTLQVVSEQSESPRLAQIAQEALGEVRKGIAVSDALAMHPKIFPPVYTQTLRAGEASGQFPEVASRLADFQEKEVVRRSTITSALVYPSMLAGVAVMVVIFMVTFVVPRLGSVFADLGGELPAATKLLLALTGFLTQNGLFIIGGIVLAALTYRGWVATEAGALARDGMLFKIPKVGPVIEKAVVSRFARVLGTLLFGGVPILESLRLAGLAAGNRTFAKGAAHVQNEVREGRTIHEAMRDSGAFPPVLTHMVAIGEETGDVPKMLDRVANSLDFEVDHGVRRLTTMAEPLIIVTMAVIVGFVVIAVVLPIFQAQELVK